MVYQTLQAAMLDPMFSGLSDADSLTAGNVPVVVSSSEGTLWSYDGVAIQYGAAQAELLGAAIAAAGFPLAAQSYVSKGIDLSLPLVQGELTAIAGNFPAVAESCNSLKAIGVTMGTSWQLWGLSQPTVDQITAARTINANAADVANMLNEVILPLINSGCSKAQLKTAVAGA